MKPLRWRVQSDDSGGFDEIVVTSHKGPAVLHAEALSERSWFISVAGFAIWVHLEKSEPVISMFEDQRKNPKVKP